ncbi:hypothetical protein PENSPDRAFT_428282 [Peniophora sp. CONT]|nr:hypothetical protein PENSPDRAFT_428282 [Peniophora sp. CONT]
MYFSPFQTIVHIPPPTFRSATSSTRASYPTVFVSEHVILSLTYSLPLSSQLETMSAKPRRIVTAKCPGERMKDPSFVVGAFKVNRCEAESLVRICCVNGEEPTCHVLVTTTAREGIDAQAVDWLVRSPILSSSCAANPGDAQHVASLMFTTPMTIIVAMHKHRAMFDSEPP